MNEEQRKAIIDEYKVFEKRPDASVIIGNALRKPNGEVMLTSYLYQRHLIKKKELEIGHLDTHSMAYKIESMKQVWNLEKLQEAEKEIGMAPSTLEMLIEEGKGRVTPDPVEKAGQVVGDFLKPKESPASGNVSVKAYSRTSGNVKGHSRSSPDGDASNNFSFRK